MLKSESKSEKTAETPSSDAAEIPEEVAQDAVTLVSADGVEFVLSRKCAMHSGTLSNMLSIPDRFTESVSKRVELKNLQSKILAKVCEYLKYKEKYGNESGDIPEFKVEPELSLEVLMAADYLEC